MVRMPFNHKSVWAYNPKLDYSVPRRLVVKHRIEQTRENNFAPVHFDATNQNVKV